MFERATRLCWMSPRMVTFRLLMRSQPVANRQRIQQPLRRMLVRSIAGVDHRNVQMPRDKIRRAGRTMSHHQTIRLHRIQVENGVEQRLAFFQAGRFGLQIHRVRAKPRSRRSES